MQRKSNWQLHVEHIEELLKESYDKLKITAIFLQKQKGYYNEDEVEDLVHDTCRKAINKMEQFEGGNFLAWVKIILTNTFKSMRRRKYHVIKHERVEKAKYKVEVHSFYSNPKSFDTFLVSDDKEHAKKIPPTFQKYPKITLFQNPVTDPCERWF